MKDAIHPKLNNSCAVTCACGNKFVTISTKDTISVDICSNCHPFYTGKQKFVDTEGRIVKFEKKRATSAEKQKAQEARPSKPEKTGSSKTTTKKPSLKEMMEQAKTANN